MFLHSATSGPALRGEAFKAGLSDRQGKEVFSDFRYMRFGVLTASIQLALSIAWVVASVNPSTSAAMRFLPAGLLLVIVGVLLRLTVPQSDSNVRLAASVASALGVIIAIGTVVFVTVVGSAFWEVIL
jgi:hypothetical protein